MLKKLLNKLAETIRARPKRFEPHFDPETNTWSRTKETPDEAISADTKREGSD